MIYGYHLKLMDIYDPVIHMSFWTCVFGAL